VRLDGSDAQAVERAAELLAAGELVAFPTETVYGLGARADEDAAVAKIFRAKGRPQNHPLIVHVAGPEQINRFAAKVSAPARRLIDAFWPGPLTLILPRLGGVACAAAGGQDSIGLRFPSHPVARALLDAALRRGVEGVAGPSANRFGRVSPTRASHAEDEFGDTLAVLDGGPCSVGIESSIVDCTRSRPVLLRPGLLTRARIEAVVGETLGMPDADAPRAPGTLAAHYAPNAALRLMPTRMLHTALQLLDGTALKLAVYSRGSVPTVGVTHRRMPAHPEQVAHELFSVLREFDASGMQLIWVEEPPPDPAWDGVRDRLQRAAVAGGAPTRGISEH
jgi:L-threonylcarbamoyladenylate synthase